MPTNINAVIMEEYKEIYSKNQADHIASEFTKLKDSYYLEHVGATIYSDIQIANVFQDLKNNLFGNPHAFNNSSKFTEDVIDQVRYQVLEHFNTNLDEYSIIFTSGATGALKLVAENFNYHSTNSATNNEENGTFTYLEDNHTSVLGMREYAKNIKTLSHEEAFKIFNTSKSPLEHVPIENGQSLFVYPAQCNFSGTKYPLSWIDKVQNGILNTLPKTNPTKWFCMLDAASFVSCNKLDLKKFKPDFVCISFYKIFGYPSGLGALLVKNTSGHVLTKTYFGGGTVQMTLHSEHILRPVLHERFEDGTLPFLSITSVRHGFETFKRLSLDMEMISTHTFSLAKYVHHSLLLMHHSNGNPIAVLYHDTNFDNKTYQGAIVNFNLLRANGQYIGYSEVLQMANLYNIHLRTGCFCNPGACQRHLKLSPADVKQHFQAGHVCGDQNDLIDGYPTGSIRISFGYMSTKTDADKLLQMIQDCFLLKPVRKIIPSTWLEFEKRCKQKFSEMYDEQMYSTNNNKPLVIKTNVENTRHVENVIKETNINGIVQHIFVYPVKSCGPYSVQKSWKIESTGLSYDREWMIITSAGVCLTQKREPRMCLVMPIIKIDEGVMELHFPNMQSINVPLNVGECMSNSEVSLCQNKVCGDRVRCFDCGDEVAYWLSEALERSDLRLVRQNSNHLRTNRKGEQSQLSLANQAQFLLLNLASVRYLENSIQDYEDYDKDISNLMHRFRANIVIDSNKAFIENSSDMITIGNHEFKCTGPCTRCQMICIDQTTGEKTIEPLRTLSVLTESKIRFGVYLAHISATDTALSVHETVSFQ